MKFLKRLIVLLLLIGMGVAVALFLQMKQGLTLRISDAQINAAIRKNFPAEKVHLGLVKTVLEQPKVVLEAGQDRMKVEARVTAGTTFGKIQIGKLKVGSEKTYQATATIDGGIDFDPTTGEFFFKDAKLLDMDIGELPEKIREPAREAISLIARETLNRRPLYTLKETDFKHDIAKLLLDQVTIENGRLAVTMKLPESESEPLLIERNK